MGSYLNRLALLGKAPSKKRKAGEEGSVPAPSAPLPKVPESSAPPQEPIHVLVDDDDEEVVGAALERRQAKGKAIARPKGGKGEKGGKAAAGAGKAPTEPGKGAAGARGSIPSERTKLFGGFVTPEVNFRHPEQFFVGADTDTYKRRCSHLMTYLSLTSAFIFDHMEAGGMEPASTCEELRKKLFDTELEAQEKLSEADQEVIRLKKQLSEHQDSLAKHITDSTTKDKENAELRDKVDRWKQDYELTQQAYDQTKEESLKTNEALLEERKKSKAFEEKIEYLKGEFAAGIYESFANCVQLVKRSNPGVDLSLKVVHPDFALVEGRVLNAFTGEEVDEEDPELPVFDPEAPYQAPVESQEDAGPSGHQDNPPGIVEDAGAGPSGEPGIEADPGVSTVSPSF